MPITSVPGCSPGSDWQATMHPASSTATKYRNLMLQIYRFLTIIQNPLLIPDLIPLIPGLIRDLFPVMSCLLFLIPDLTRDLLGSAAFAPKVPSRADLLQSRQGKRPFRPKSLPRLRPKCRRMAIICNRGLALSPHPWLDPPHPGLDPGSLCAKVHALDLTYTFPLDSLREGPCLGPSGQR